MGVQEMAAEQYAAAVAWFDEAARLDPDSVASHTWIGVICDEQLREPKKAMEHFQRAVELAPNNLRARLGIARQLLHTADVEKGRREMLSAIELPEAKENPGLVDKAYRDLASVSPSLEQAAEYYAKAVAISPNPVYPLVQLAYVYRSMGKHEEAIKRFLEVRQQVPTYAPIYLELAKEYRITGDWEQALRELQAYMRHRNGPGEQNHLIRQAAELAELAGLMEKASELRHKLLHGLLKEYNPAKAAPELCSEIASELEKVGELKNAEPYLRKAVEFAEAGAKPTLRGRLAMLYEKLGLSDKAAAELAECIRSAEPRASIGYRTKLAAILERADKNAEAEEVLKEILNIPGAKADGHAELGLFHARKGNVEQAALELREAVKLADAAQSIRYRTLLGIMYAHAERYEEAERVLTEAKNMFPEDASANNALASFYAERGMKLNVALDLVQKALKIHPENPYFLDCLGLVYLKQGRPKDALPELLKAAAMVSDSMICDHLGDVYVALGQAPKAGLQWKRSLELDPKIKGVREKLEQLKKAP